MDSSGLERLVEKEEETTTDRVRRSILASEQQFDGIYGIRDVKENLMDALERASFISKQGYIPIILLIGPSGSGKTEIINSMIRSYKNYTKTDRMFTLNINGVKCPYNENPYNLYRSILPVSIPGSAGGAILNKKRPEICYTCEQNLEKSDGKEIKLDGIFPQSSITEFGDNVLSLNFINVIKNSNRSILTISADKSRFENINPKVFQFMNNIYDNNLSDMAGNRIPLDSLIIMHSNESFMELPDEAKRESRPLLERIIRVNVRRNLSYSAEEKMAQELNIPVLKTIPHALGYMAKFNVLSRVDLSGTGSETDELENILELLDYYDSSRLGELERNMTRSMSNFLSKLLPDYGYYISDKDKVENRYLKDAAKSLIVYGNEYKSGWTTGVSPRSITDILDFNYSSNKAKDYISFSDIARYINNNLDRLNEDKADDIKNYIDKLVVDNVGSDVGYAILSFYYGEHFKDYTNAITAYSNLLINNKQDEEFKDQNGYLSEASRYFDVEGLKNEINHFKFRKMPLGVVNYSPTFESLFGFLISTGKEFIKKESKFKSFIGESGKEVEKNSELYPYIAGFLKSRFGYFDEAVEEAFKIYKEGTIFYDE